MGSAPARTAISLRAGGSSPVFLLCGVRPPPNRSRRAASSATLCGPPDGCGRRAGDCGHRSSRSRSGQLAGTWRRASFRVFTRRGAAPFSGAGDEARVDSSSAAAIAGRPPLRVHRSGAGVRPACQIGCAGCADCDGSLAAAGCRARVFLWRHARAITADRPYSGAAPDGPTSASARGGRPADSRGSAGPGAAACVGDVAQKCSAGLRQYRGVAYHVSCSGCR